MKVIRLHEGSTVKSPPCHAWQAAEPSNQPAPHLRPERLACCSASCPPLPAPGALMVKEGGVGGCQKGAGSAFRSDSLGRMPGVALSAQKASPPQMVMMGCGAYTIMYTAGAYIMCTAGGKKRAPRCLPCTAHVQRGGNSSLVPCQPQQPPTSHTKEGDMACSMMATALAPGPDTHCCTSRHGGCCPHRWGLSCWRSHSRRSPGSHQGGQERGSCVRMCGRPGT